MKFDDSAYAQLCDSLRQEAGEQVEHIGAVLLTLERGEPGAPREKLLDDAFRQAHNLKGAASSLAFGVTAHLAHEIESMLAALRRGTIADPRRAYDALHGSLTAVAAALAADPAGPVPPVVKDALDVLGAALAAAGAPDPSATPVPVSSAGAATSAVSKAPALPPSQSSVSSVSAVSPVPGAPPSPPAAPSEAPRTSLGPPGAAAVPAAPAAPADESLRVSTRKLGALMSQVGELLAARLRTDQRLAELRGVLAAEQMRLDRRAALRQVLRDDAPPRQDRFTRRLGEAISGGFDDQKELVRRLRDLVRAFEADALQSTILSGELQEDIRRIQTFPLASVLDPLPRALRTLARAAGVEVELVVEGAELELDKKVLDELRDPLNHLLRNAVDHGMEAPARRAAAGKPARGTIVIRAEHRGDSIMITVADDGPGVDLEGVRRAAVARGLLGAAQATEAPEPRLLELLFAPGLTTRDEATGLSGRGVGLDSVRTNVERLRGSVHVDTRAGAGTTFSIVLPLTIYVVHALIVRCGDHTLALPISSIQRIMRVAPADVLEVEGAGAVVVDGRPVALVRLASLLGIAGDERPRSERLPVVVIGAGETRCALAADDIVGDQTVLAKSLEPPLARIRNIAGATILGDGSVILMLNPFDLLRSASAREARAAGLGLRLGAAPVRPRLLLADDSYTTRALERSVLELAGFDVTAVADGQEALAALERTAFDVVVSDVSMPRVDGLALCARVRAESRHRTVPVVLVTSLATDEDRRRGLEAGADAYIVKSEFDHEKLVHKLHELLGR